MESYGIFRDIAIILVAAKFCGLAARRLKMPSVVGNIIAGLLIGPCMFHLVQPSDFLTQMAEIGVVLLMFSAGLESDTKEIVRSGPKALAIAASGVIIPLVAGTGLFLLFYGGANSERNLFYEALFIGCILTATSVSITVEALRELGHLKERVGTTIMSAAIIDDVLGIIVLTLISGLKDPSTSLVMVAWNTLLFFLFAGVVGYIIYRAFAWIDQNHPHTRRVPILALAFCLAMAQKGLLLGLLNSMFFTSVIILILVSAIVTPILLKVLYHRDGVATQAAVEQPTAQS